MNFEELQKLIKEIKSKRMRDYLLSNLNIEYELDSLGTTSYTIEQATKRFKDKIRACKNIEEDFSEKIIPAGETYLLIEKLDTLRLCLARLYDNKIQTRDDFNQIKIFVFNFLTFQDIHLKLKIFDLTIKLLEETSKSLKFNKDFMAIFNSLESLVNNPGAFKSENLNNINELSKKDIKKNFYGIVYRLNNKLFFQELLSLLLEKIKKMSNDSLLIQFNHEFVILCAEDSRLDADDYIQLITLVFQSLRCYEVRSKSQGFLNFQEKLKLKSLDNSLVDFENEFKERMPPLMAKLDASFSSLDEDKIQEPGISIYFPALIKNEKLRCRFYEAQSKFLNKKTPLPNSFFQYLSTGLEKISMTANGLKINAKELVVDTRENLKEIAGTSTKRLKEFFEQSSENSCAEENINLGEINHNQSLMLELAAVKKDLNVWYLTLSHYNVPSNKLDTFLIDLNQRPEILISAVRSNIVEQFKELISRTIKELEKINTEIEKKGYWQAKLEINQPNLAKKLLQRGYFNFAFSIKKIKAKLGETPFFGRITDFISRQSFWTLLFSFGIVRWPWMDKTTFAHNWAEQLCLPKILSETEKLKTSEYNEALLRKVITLSEEFFPHKNQPIIQILNDFKSYIEITIKKIDTITQKIEDSLRESNYATLIGSPANGLFGKKIRSSNLEDNSKTDVTTLSLN